MQTAVDWWAGEGGDAYTKRNQFNETSIDLRSIIWRKVLNEIEFSTDKPTILEVGANIGLGIYAFRSLIDANFMAVEPNDKARKELKLIVPDAVADISEIPDGAADMVFTAGVMIYIPPEELLDFCTAVHRVSREWIVCWEYFSADLRMVPYRGEDNRLWTRDFGGFYLDNFPDLEPWACGFAWKRLTGLDDVTWTVLRKK